MHCLFRCVARHSPTSSWGLSQLFYDVIGQTLYNLPTPRLFCRLIIQLVLLVPVSPQSRSVLWPGLTSLYIRKDCPDSICLVLARLVKSICLYADMPAQPSITEALELWRSWSQIVKLVQAVDAATLDKHLFISAFKTALDRLEGMAVQGSEDYIEKAIAKHGVKLAIDKVTSAAGFPCPAKVANYLNVMRICAALTKNQLDASALAEEHGPLQQALPLYVKLQGLDMQFLKQVAPEQHEQVESFLTAFAGKLKGWLQIVENETQTNVELLDTYRPDQFDRKCRLWVGRG